MIKTVFHKLKMVLFAAKHIFQCQNIQTKYDFYKMANLTNTYIIVYRLKNKNEVCMNSSK